MEYAWDIFYFQYSPAADEDKIRQIVKKYDGFSRIIGFYKNVVGIPYLTDDLTSELSKQSAFDLMKELSPFGKVYDLKRITSQNFNWEISQAPFPLELFVVKPKKGLFKRLRTEFPDAVIIRDKDEWSIKFQFSYGHKKALLILLTIFGVKLERESYLWTLNEDYFIRKYIRNKKTKELKLIEWRQNFGGAWVIKNGAWTELSAFSPVDWEGPIPPERLITSWREIWNSS